MKPRQTCEIVLLAIALSASHVGATEGRLWLPAKVKGKTAKLAFDSGSNVLALSPGGLKRLGVRFIPIPTNDFPKEVWSGTTEEVSVILDGTAGQTKFLVLKLGAWEADDFDGVVGWAQVSENVWKIDANDRKVALLEEVPKQVVQWERLCLATNFGTLDLNIPCDGATNRVLCIDTGADGGVALPDNEWCRWKETHPNVPLTLEIRSTPSDGFFVQERAWADEIALGQIILRGIPIEQSGPANSKRWGSRYAGTLGLAALKRLDLIIDGRDGLAYLRTKRDRPPHYQHNRLGAVFIPTAEHTNQAVARVIGGSPAYEAGIRNNDILLEVDGVRVTSWHSGWLSRFSLPSGSKLKMTLNRNGETFNTTAVLRDIVCPRATTQK